MPGSMAWMQRPSESEGKRKIL